MNFKGTSEDFSIGNSPSKISDRARSAPSQALTNLQALYDPELFHNVAKTVQQRLTEYFKDCTTPPYKGLTYQTPENLVAAIEGLFISTNNEMPSDFSEAFSPTQIAQRVDVLAKAFLQTTNRLHSPHYMGHQVSPALPLAGLFESLGTITNQNGGIYEMGPFPTAVEKTLIAKMGAYIGWPRSTPFDAICTHGGSMANLTAVLAARNARYPMAWSQGLPRTGAHPVVITSADSHYSLARGAGITGIGTEQVVKAPLDSKRRIDPKKLKNLVEELKQKGDDVFCIVGSACTTSTGSFDPLDEIGDIANASGAWFHVDGAHGAPLLLSRRHRHLLKGIHRADSVTWDAHKMMLVPALCTMLFYRTKAQSYQAFHQDAPYLFSKQSPLDYDSAARTIECTKRPLAMATWMLWAVFGPGLFETFADTTVGLTKDFYALLSAAKDFEPLHEPQCNILCFRFVPPGMEWAGDDRISELQMDIRTKLTHQGNFYITATRLDGRAYLRVSIMNPLSDRTHLMNLMNEIRHLGQIYNEKPLDKKELAP